MQPAGKPPIFFPASLTPTLSLWADVSVANDHSALPKHYGSGAKSSAALTIDNENSPLSSRKDYVKALLRAFSASVIEPGRNIRGLPAASIELTRTRLY